VILTVTLNPAWDVTYTVARLELGGSHRVEEMQARAGGKGINVGRVLHAMGQATLVTGVLAGGVGDAVARDLETVGIDAWFVELNGSGQTRRTVTVVDGSSGTATVLREPGPAAGTLDWPALRERLASLIQASEVTVLAGSLPPAVPDDAYADLIEAAHRAGGRVVLDAEGAALRAGLAAGPDLVKPNQAEMASVVGSSDPYVGARALLAAGARAAVVSVGPDGLVAAMGDQLWHARPPALEAVNATGAGDAAAAALAVGLRDRLSWPDMLRTAVAWSAAAVLEPVAGRVSPATVSVLLEQATCVAIDEVTRPC
jgi:tagatose 6-phosphate kinase